MPRDFSPETLRKRETALERGKRLLERWRRLRAARRLEQCSHAVHTYATGEWQPAQRSTRVGKFDDRHSHSRPLHHRSEEQQSTPPPRVMGSEHYKQASSTPDRPILRDSRSCWSGMKSPSLSPSERKKSVCLDMEEGTRADHSVSLLRFFKLLQHAIYFLSCQMFARHPFLAF
jgi:hypothetical protein